MQGITIINDNIIIMTGSWLMEANKKENNKKTSENTSHNRQQ